MYNCINCIKSFTSVSGLSGHSRMHGESQGTITKIFCSCLITRTVILVSALQKYQENLIECKICSKIFRPGRGRTTFCGLSCSATYNNTVYVKRKKQERIPKPEKIKKVYTESEKRAKNVANVQAYRARKYSATLPDTDMKLIRLIYQACPTGYEVDHIIALSEGGPHHQDNLQYLPALVNRKKNRSQNYDKTLAVQWQDLINE